MADGYLLSEDDLVILRATIERERGMTRNTQNRTFSQNPQASKTTECYLVVTPEGGIPGVSTPLGTGTGTGPGNQQFTIFSGICQIKQVINGAVTNAGFPLQTVYNLSNNEVPGNQLALVVKDKYGAWFIADTGASEDDTVFVRFDGTVAKKCNYFGGNYLELKQLQQLGTGTGTALGTGTGPPCFSVFVTDPIFIFDLNSKVNNA